MARCKRCNKSVGQLYDGLCAACLTVRTREVNEIVEAEMNGSTELVPDIHKERFDVPGAWADFVKKPISSEASKVETTTYKRIIPGKGTVTKKTKLDTDGVAYYMVVGEYTDRDRRAFAPIFKQLYKKYLVLFKNGTYFICKKSEFGKNGIGGDVVEQKGGLIVFKATEFYDPSKIQIDSYADDDIEVDSIIEDSEFSLGEDGLEFE